MVWVASCWRLSVQADWAAFPCTVAMQSMPGPSFASISSVVYMLCWFSLMRLINAFYLELTFHRATKCLLGWSSIILCIRSDKEKYISLAMKPHLKLQSLLSSKYQLVIELATEDQTEKVYWFRSSYGMHQTVWNKDNWFRTRNSCTTWKQPPVLGFAQLDRACTHKRFSSTSPSRAQNGLCNEVTKQSQRNAKSTDLLHALPFSYSVRDQSEPSTTPRWRWHRFSRKRAELVWNTMPQIFPCSEPRVSWSLRRKHRICYIKYQYAYL